MKSWPRVALGALLAPAQESIAVRADASYPNIGMYSFGRGLFRKPPIKGISSSAKSLFRIRAGNFIYSRLFAFEGAYGVVDEAFDGYFVSNEYPSFAIDDRRLLAGYLRAYFLRPSVWEAIAMGSKGVGSRRMRIQPDQILAHRIPLPELTEQQTIVSRIDTLADKHRQLPAHLDAIESDADHLIALRFRDCIADVPYRPMSKVAPLARRAVTIEPDSRYAELGVRSFYRGTFQRRTLAGSEFTWQKLFRVEANDLIFSNIMAWEQAIAVAKPEDHGCVGNHRLLTCAVDQNLMLPEFLAYYFMTEQGFGKVYSASAGTAARNRTLVADSLASITVPVPTLPMQRSFALLREHVRTLKACHDATRKASAALQPAILDKLFVNA